MAVFLTVTLAGSTACDPRVLNFDHGRDSGGPTSGSVVCNAAADWLPNTAPPILYEPRAHPAPDCPFYQGAYQNFLLATLPAANGDPAFASYLTIDDLFVKSTPLPAGALAPPGAHRGTALRAWLGDVKQAGARKILIDQKGHSLYYGIHVNRAYVDFVNAYGLRTAAAIQNADPNLSFPPGVVALKSAWKDIDPSDGAAGDYSTYITTMAWVSHLQQDPFSFEIHEDRNSPRQIRVALVALHVAYTLPGHPEFIWSTFEHADATGAPDVAPASTTNPIDDDPFSYLDSNAVSAQSFPLYRAGTIKGDANHPFVEEDLQLDEPSQTLGPRPFVPTPASPDAGVPFSQGTSVYRAFPGSRSNTVNPDDEVVALNRSVAELFSRNAATVSPADRRGSYRLVGGIWLDKGDAFRINALFQNDQSSPYYAGVGDAAFFASIGKYGTESPYSILGGEDRLSSPAIESFTAQPGSFNNCLFCHNTQATNSNGVTCEKDFSGIRLLKAKNLGVSHVLSRFLLDECQGSQPPASCLDTCISP